MPTAFHLKIQLRDAQPAISREVLVDPEMTLRKFHGVIQAAMGWGNHHLYGFACASGTKRFWNIAPDQRFEPQRKSDFGEPSNDDAKFRLCDVLLEPKSKLLYLYDFGDDWEHTVTLSKIVETALTLPHLLTAQNACPPEDCGGPWGAQAMSAAWFDKSHPEHAMAREIFGDEEPGTLHFERLQRDVARLQPKLKSKKSATPTKEQAKAVWVKTELSTRTLSPQKAAPQTKSTRKASLEASSAPLTADELGQLDDALFEAAEVSMTVEAVDGLFCAALVGPERLMLSDCLPMILGLEDGAVVSKSLDRVLPLLMRHWNSIAQSLTKGERVEPVWDVAEEDTDGVAQGNEWAEGFMVGIGLRMKQWDPIIRDKKTYAWVAPMMLLGLERSGNDEVEAIQLSPDERARLIEEVPSCLERLYKLFAKHRGSALSRQPTHLKLVKSSPR